MGGRRSTGAPHDGWGGAAGPDAVGAPAGPGPGAEASAEPGPRPGAEVAGVRLDALVGRGSAGAVWSGTEVGSGARVAVKLLDRPTGPREAALLEAVRHPHVLPLRRYVSAPPALVTDLAAGGSLAAQVEARGTLAAGEVVTVLAPVADALAALHAHGVVHGDVTATNILFLDRGRPVLADLGVAGLVGDGAAWATPGYAAPEVLAGARPGPAADVHGLAAAAWLALTGSVPPPEPERLPLSLLAPDCPPALQAAVTTALDPDPALRPTPCELAAAARAACPGLVVRLVPGAALGVRADEAVTYLVRESAAADGEPGTATRRARLARRLRGLVTPAVRVRLTGPESRPDGPGGRREARGAGSWALVAAGACLVGLLLLGWEAGVVPAAPGDHTAAGTHAAAVTVAEPAGPVPSAVVAPDAPEDLAATVAALVAARQQALRAGDAGALALVHHPDGTTLGVDQGLVRSGPLDVRYEVLAVRPVPGAPRSARVELVTTSDGATSVEDVVVEVALAADGWRVRSVGP